MSSPEEMFDPITHPKHYNSHPSGVECADITVHMPTMIGCAIKYLWRFDLKDKPVEDLRKAIWCIERHIKMLEIQREKPTLANSTPIGYPVGFEYGEFKHCEHCHSTVCEAVGYCYYPTYKPS